MGVLSQYMLVEVHFLENKSIKQQHYISTREELVNSIYCTVHTLLVSDAKKTSSNH